MLRRLCLVSALVAGLAAPAAAEPACQLGFEGCYLDIDGAPRLAAPAYRELTRRRDAAWLRAALEEAAALGAGTAWYWIDRERQVADWDFPSIKERFTFEAWRFDNNPFDINFFWHPLNGAGFHWLARSNSLSLHASFWYGMATSMTWEYALEFREKVSINDVIATPAAGVAFGEVLHGWSRYLGSAPGPARSWHPALRWTVGFWRTLHNHIDGAGELGGNAAADNLGLSSDYWHRLRLSLATSSAGASSSERTDDGDVGALAARLSAELAALPGYRRPGRVRQFFADGNLTRLEVALGNTGRDIRVDAMLLGWHAQDLPAPGSGRVGHARTIGLSLAYHYQRNDAGAFRDRLGIVHLPGPAIDGLWRGPGWQLETGLRAHADFAGLSALTYDRWKRDHADAVEKTILRKHGYYYGWGASASGWLELRLPRLSLGARALVGRYASQEGLDRSQEDILDDIAVDDSLVDGDAWLRVHPSGGRWYLEGRARRQRRHSEIGGLGGEQTLRTFGVELGVEL